jgi:hypothetical protein
MVGLLVVVLCHTAWAQSLYPNADSEAIFQRTIAGLNQGTISAAECHRILMRLVPLFEVPSDQALIVYGPHLWKLSVLAQQAYFHRLTEAAMASLLESALGRDAAASAWAQQLKYANIHKEAKRKLEAAPK